MSDIDPMIILIIVIMVLFIVGVALLSVEENEFAHYLGGAFIVMAIILIVGVVIAKSIK